MYKSPTLLILAAGLGSRYGGVKQLEQVGPHGETILEYCLYDAINAGFKKVLFVVRDEILNDAKNAFESILKIQNVDVDFVIQRLDEPINIFKKLNETKTVNHHQDVALLRKKPWGTAHAVLCAMNYIHSPFAVINADDLYGFDSFKMMYNQLYKPNQQQHCSIVGYSIDKTLSDFGSVSRGICCVDENQKLLSITERKNISRFGTQIIYEENNQRVVIENNSVASMNFWGFHPDIFISLKNEFEQFISNHYNDNSSEFLIPTVIEKLLSKNKITVSVCNSSSQWFGITYPDDKYIVQQAISNMIEKGIYPKKLWI